MSILVTGATGFIGRALVKQFLENGQSITAISRNIKKAKSIWGDQVKIFPWDYTKESFPQEALESIDTVIHLMGESIAGLRWSKRKMKAIYESRIISTQKLVAALPENVHTFISSSAIGFYEENKQRIFDESDNLPGNDFLAKVCIDWEYEAEKAKTDKRKVIITRNGVVLGHGGFLRTISSPFEKKIGAIFGRGDIYLNWIHIDDFVRAIQYILDQSIAGKFNMTSPQPMCWEELGTVLCQIYKQKFLLHIPIWLAKLIMGEAYKSILKNHQIHPEKLLESGFLFQYNDGMEAINDIIE